MENVTILAQIPNGPQSFTADPNARFLVGFFHLFFAWPLVSLYVFLMFVIVKNKKLRENPFYFLSLNLGIGEILYLLSFSFYGIFVLGAGNPFEFSWIINEIFSFVETMGFYNQLFMMNILAVNRYIAVCWFKFYSDIFTKKFIKILIILSWTLAILMYSSQMIANCKEIVAIYSWYLTWFDSNSKCSQIHIQINTIVVTGGVFAPICVYIILILHLRRITKSLVFSQNSQNSEANKRKIERNMMLQFFFVTFIFTANEICLRVLFRLTDSPNASIVVNFLNIINCTNNPIMYLSFGSELRKYFRFTVGNTNGFPVTTAKQTVAPVASVAPVTSVVPVASATPVTSMAPPKRTNVEIEEGSV